MKNKIEYGRKEVRRKRSKKLSIVHNSDRKIKNRDDYTELYERD